uniref:Uncharacterized protein n=1 Tax=Phaseolus vulgaris TaxID=3885 RepID=T2DMG6_PHAVU|nr:hypothetical protein [Phaseolus vulgaris]
MQMMSRALLFHAPGGDGAEEECSTSSSIGRNSDVSSERSAEGGENEVESVYRGPLHSMETLEEVLPIRRSISKFYGGKSKSFTSLADVASSPSAKDIAKPENAYTRKRRNLMALNNVLDKNRSYPLRFIGGAICKRSISLSRSNLALAVAMNNSDSSSSITSEEDSGSSSNSIPSPSSLSSLPALHPRNKVASGACPSSPSCIICLLEHLFPAGSTQPWSPSIGNETAHPS